MYDEDSSVLERNLEIWVGDIGNQRVVGGTDALISFLLLPLLLPLPLPLLLLLLLFFFFFKQSTVCQVLRWLILYLTLKLGHRESRKLVNIILGVSVMVCLVEINV